MTSLLDAYPDFSVRILRRADNGREVWTETLASAGALQIAAVIIWTVDAETRTLASGRYYSEVVQHDAQPISDFMKSLGIPQEGVSPKDRSTD